MARSLAVDKDGNLSYCSVPPEMRGMRGCPHVGHQEEKESSEDFIRRITVESNTHKWRTTAEKRLGESDIKYKARVEFNKTLVEYESLSHVDGGEHIRAELETEYGIKNRELQDKTVVITKAIRDPDFKTDLSTVTSSKLRELAPDLFEGLAEDIIRFRDDVTAINLKAP